ncbi:MAG: tetraacyldisaccharide 4'-kinase [Paludibacteraceae bacterium]
MIIFVEPMPKPHKNIAYYVLSKLYGGVTGLRNFLFDKKILHSVGFDVPVICIGNLAVGGTGKTPHTEFLLNILTTRYKTAVLSRGYKRQTTGFLLADDNATAKSIGDEPYQIYSKFKTIVAVDEKRVHGTQELLNRYPDMDVILLDDAFQHRHIQAGLTILLTDYNLLFTDDFLLPYGTLREKPKNSQRADVVIVTKCPQGFLATENMRFRKRLNLQASQELFFSSYDYGKVYSAFDKNRLIPEINPETTVFVVTGIQNPDPMRLYLLQFTTKIDTFCFPDHHDFSQMDLDTIEKKFRNTPGNKIIITTEKDTARLMSNHYLSDLLKNNIFTLSIEVKILNGEEEKFNKKIYDYVRKNSTNG